MTQPHKARKRFGQNFLHDQAVIEKIVAAVALSAQELVIEIGPGQGALTYKLLSSLPASARLLAIELDRDLIIPLARAAESRENFSVVEADVLDTNLLDYRSNSAEPLTICGNLPYNISSPLLIKLLESELAWKQKEQTGAPSQFSRAMIFMLQKEVVDRICAPSGSKTYGRLGVLLQSVFDCHLMFEVPPSAFSPAPKVTSAVMRMAPKAQPLVKPATFPAFKRVVAAAFAQRRKTLRNNLKGLVSIEAFAQLDIDPGLRAEMLAPAQFVALSEQANDAI